MRIRSTASRPLSISYLLNDEDETSVASHGPSASSPSESGARSAPASSPASVSPKTRNRKRKRDEHHDTPVDNTVDEDQTESDNDGRDNDNDSDNSSDLVSLEVFKVETPEPRSPTKKRKPRAEIDETSLDNDPRTPLKFVAYRVFRHPAQTEIEVKWKDAPNSWEVEFHLQKRWPHMLYLFWLSLGGRQRATGLDVFHIFRVLKHHPRQRKYLVQWVGYSESPGDVTWEPEALVRDTAPHLLAEFETREAEAGSEAIHKAIPAPAPAPAPVSKKYEPPPRRGRARETGKSSSKNITN